MGWAPNKELEALCFFGEKSLVFAEAFLCWRESRQSQWFPGGFEVPTLYLSSGENASFAIHLSSVQLLSHVQLFVSPWTLQHARFPCPSPTPRVAQTYVHRVGDATQPSHPLLSPSPPAFNLSQHQHLFQWVSSSHQVAKILELQLQHQFFQWIFRTDFL